jgi:16S rRNA (cytosine967-C5)-methyltransferase
VARQVQARESSVGDQAGLGARRAALAIVDAALDRRGGLEEALAGPALARLADRDRAFARVLAMGVLRRKGELDRLLAARLAKPPPEPVLALLRLGAAQLLHLETPGHAAVATTVELAGQNKATRPFKSLVNAVLRGIARDGAALAPPDALAPEWLYARWRSAYGEAAARAMAAMIVEEPATDLTLRDASDAAALAEALPAEILPGGSLRARRRGDLAGWPGYGEGRWWVQDASAAIPARLLHVKPGESALDLCAAPGGKALQLAAAGATLVALDRSAARLERLRQNLERARLVAEIVTAEATAWPDERRFDAVLLDAPCTATGTFRRHPDVLWASRPADIAKLAQVQSTLLESAARRVRPGGGRLLYCVCSLEPEEGEAQAEHFLAAHGDFRIDPIQPVEGGAPAQSLTPKGTLRILPHHLPGGTDGFFIARLVRG